MAAPAESPPHAPDAARPPTAIDPAGPAGLIRVRAPWLTRLNMWRKHSPFNPYWIEHTWLTRAARTLAPHASGLLLDVGVGERPYGKLFAPYVTRYLGLEYPPVADNLNPAIWGRLRTIAHLVDVFGDGMRLPFRDGVIDTVLSFEVIEHMPDPDAALREFARVTRPGGRLLLTAPFCSPLHQLPFDFYRYTPRGLETMLERHGYVLERLAPLGNFSTTTGAVLSHWLVRTLGARGRNHDGSIVLARWRGLLLAPLLALVQVFFATCARFTTDDTLTMGHLVVARRAGPGAGPGSAGGPAGG